MDARLDAEALSARLAAIASPQRLRILAELATDAVHVSELARRVEMSRALLYMHLTRLEESGFVTGRLELGPDGRALKYFEAVPFTLTIDLTAIVAAVASTPNHTTPSLRTTPPSKEHPSWNTSSPASGSGSGPSPSSRSSAASSRPS